MYLLKFLSLEFFFFFFLLDNPAACRLGTYILYGRSSDAWLSTYPLT